MRWPRRVDIGQPGDPFLIRWELFRIGNLPRVFLHKFVRSDYDRALHNHPWPWYVSVLLWGQYVEHLPEGTLHRKALSIAFRGSDHQHRIELIKECVDRELKGSTARLPWPLREQPCWTLFITGPDTRRWGFFCPSGFVDSADFQGCD